MSQIKYRISSSFVFHEISCWAEIGERRSSASVDKGNVSIDLLFPRKDSYSLEDT